MRTSAQMIAKYNARYNPVDQLQARTDTEQLAKDNFAEYANDWEVFATAVRNYLDTQGIAAVNYFGYFAFANEMYAALDTCAGETYNVQGAMLIAKYTAQGLAQAALEGVASAAFPWSAPAGP